MNKANSTARSRVRRACNLEPSRVASVPYKVCKVHFGRRASYWDSNRSGGAHGSGFGGCVGFRGFLRNGVGGLVGYSVLKVSSDLLLVLFVQILNIYAGDLTWLAQGWLVRGRSP